MGMGGDGLTIGKLAKSGGVGVETVRFYERRGLIGQPPRQASGYRRYGPEIVRRIRFIQRAKDLGFSLAEIAELLALRVAGGSNCDAVRMRVTAKIDDIDDRLAGLESMRVALTRLREACLGGAPAGECPILDALDTEVEDASR